MTFHKSLDEIRYNFENGDTPREIVDVFDRHIEDLLSMNLAEKVPAAGSTISIEGQVVFSDAGDHKLSNFMEQRFLVATWFRGNW